VLPSKVLLLAKPKQMVRAELSTTCTPGTDTKT